jgi:hypothetical protein
MGMRWCVLLLLAIIGLCQPRVEALQARPTNPVIDLLNVSEGLPFEYRADIQLNVLESPKGSGAIPASVARGVLERLFHDADRAKFPYQERDVFGDQFTNSQRLDVAMASLNVDALSVRIRVISAMLRMNRVRARQLFDELHLEIPATPCKSPLVPDVSLYYSTLAKIVETSFSPSAKKRGREIAFLEEHLFPIVSPLQLPPAAELITKLHLGDEETSKLTVLYSAALGKLHATDRELGYLEKKAHLNGILNALAGINPGRGGEIIGLLNAYRNFLLTSASDSACSDESADRNVLAELFNGLRAQHEDQSIKPLHKEDLRPRARGEAALLEVIPNASEISRGLTRRLVAFRAEEQHAETGVNPLAFQDWDADASELLQRADAFDISQGECRICLFQEKAELLYALFDLSPPDSTKEKVLDHLITFMADSETQREHPLEWLYRFKLLLNLARSPSSEQNQQISELTKRIPRKVLVFLPSSMRSRIVLDLSRRRNYIMSAYVKAEEVLQNPYIMPPYQ